MRRATCGIVRRCCCALAYLAWREQERNSAKCGAALRSCSLLEEQERRSAAEGCANVETVQATAQWIVREHPLEYPAYRQALSACNFLHASQLASICARVNLHFSVDCAGMAERASASNRLESQERPAPSWFSISLVNKFTHKSR